MDFKSLYAVKEQFRRGALRVRPSEQFECIEPLDLLLASHSFRDPVVFVHASGSIAYDFVFTTWSIPLIVSQKVVHVITRYQCTGWTTYPVLIYGKDGQPILGYQGLAITGRSGAFESDLSEAFLFPPPCASGKPHAGLKGLFFPADTWDGSDIFVPAHSAYKIVTEKAKDALQENGVTNVIFRPLSELENLDVMRRR